MTIQRTYADIRVEKWQYWKWRVLLALFGYYLFYYLGRLNWGFAIPWIMADLNLTRTQVGAVASFLLWCYALGQLVHGRLGDKYGGRVMATLGGLGTVFLNWITSFGSSFMALMVPYALNGFVQAMAWAPGHGMIARWWPRKERGFANGLFVTAAGGATVMVWLVISPVVIRYGWRWGFRLPLLLTFAAAVAFWFLVRSKPADVGLTEDRDFSDSPFLKSKATPESLSGIRPHIDLLKNSKFLRCCIAGFCIYMARYGFLTWTVLYFAETAGLDLADVPLATIALPLGTFLGPVACGLLSDRYFRALRWQASTLFLLLAAAVALGLALLPLTSVAISVAIALLFLGGFFTFGSNGTCTALAIDLAGKEHASTAVGVYDFFCYLGAGLQGIVYGLILDRSDGNWFWLFSTMAGILFVAAWVISTTKK